MRNFLILLAILSLSQSKTLRDTRAEYWNRFKVEYNRTFDSARDDEARENIFWNNLKTISRHNYKFRRGTETFKMGINRLADMTFDEYSNMYTPNDSVKELAKELAEGIKFTPMILYKGGKLKAPDAFDWRDKGAVTAVKDQSICGSCYAMATVAAIESYFFTESGKLVELSEQEIVDCAGLTYNSFGCAGGAAFRVFDYIKDHGISSTLDYPYEAKEGKCRSAEQKEKIPLKGYGFVIANDDEEVLAKALVKFGPLVVSIDIDHESFQRYSSGVYYEPACTEKVNHGALLVGYTKDYWIVKNSLGEKWGEKGYINIARNRGNACSIGIAPLFPILKETGKKAFVFEYSKDKNSLTLQETTNEL